MSVTPTSFAGNTGMTFCLSESSLLQQLLTSSDPIVRRVAVKSLKSVGWMLQQNWRQYFNDPAWPERSKLAKALGSRAGLKFLRQFVRYKYFDDQMAVAVGFGKGRSKKKKKGGYTGLGSYGLAAGSLLDADPVIMAIAEKAEFGWHGPLTARARHYIAAVTKGRSKAKKPKVGRNYIALPASKSNVTVPVRSVSGAYFSRIKAKIVPYYLAKFSLNWKRAVGQTA